MASETEDNSQQMRPLIFHTELNRSECKINLKTDAYLFDICPNIIMNIYGYHKKIYINLANVHRTIGMWPIILHSTLCIQFSDI